MPDTHQGKALKLWLTVKGESTDGDAQPMIADLFALQRPDGGWSQTPDRACDAYATGQSLYVLAQAGLTAQRPEIKRDDRLSDCHASTRRQLAHDVTILEQWPAHQVAHADHLRSRFMGNARADAVGAEGRQVSGTITP